MTETLLVLNSLAGGYGAIDVLYDVDLEIARRPGGSFVRPQRHGQDIDHSRRYGRAHAIAEAISASADARSSACRRTGSRDLASDSCRKAANFFRACRCAKTST